MTSLLLVLAFLSSINGLLSDCPPVKGLLLLNDKCIISFSSSRYISDAPRRLLS